MIFLWIWLIGGIASWLFWMREMYKEVKAGQPTYYFRIFWNAIVWPIIWPWLLIRWHLAVRISNPGKIFPLSFPPLARRGNSVVLEVPKEKTLICLQSKKECHTLAHEKNLCSCTNCSLYAKRMQNGEHVCFCSNLGNNRPCWCYGLDNDWVRDNFRNESDC